MDKKTPFSFFSELEGKEVAVLTHRRADIDALSSAYLASYLISLYKGKPTIYTYEGINFEARELAKAYSIEFKEFGEKEMERIKNKEVEAVVLDTHSKEQLPFREYGEAEVFAVIDHHERVENPIKAKYEIIRSQESSTAEIFYDAKALLTKKELEIIGIAIISDSARFKNANAKTFKRLSEILEITKKPYLELLSLAFPKKPVSERIAILKAMQRLKIEEYKGYLISYSYVNNHSGESASLIAEIADVALVFSEEKEALSIRANTHFPIDISRVAKNLAKALGGAGGGHKKASGAYVGKADKEKVFSTFLKIIKEEIDKL